MPPMGPGSDGACSSRWLIVVGANDAYAHMLDEMDDEAADKVGRAIRRSQAAG